MKVVVFAHTPPPHHGQSYMVELMLRGLADPKYGVECLHVNAQFATDSADIGKFRWGKPFRLLKYCAQALRLRFREGAEALYYVPTPPLQNPLFRDWVILVLLRPWFKKTILHWHAVGLGEWLQTKPRWMQWMSLRALDRAEMSISLGKYNETDAGWFKPKKSRIVANGIPDPCPDFKPRAPGGKRATYLGLCTETKGLFDAMRGVALANKRGGGFQLTIAGPFFNAESEAKYRETMKELGDPSYIRHVGFVAGETKKRLLEETDILCFPTYYYGESFGLVVAEAMAFGSAVVATRWRSVPDLLPENYPGIVDPKSPEQIAEALFKVSARDDAAALRQRFLENFTVEKFLENLRAAFKAA